MQTPGSRWRAAIYWDTRTSNIPAYPILRRVGNVEGINAGLMPTRYVYRANINPREVKRYRQFARAALVPLWYQNRNERLAKAPEKKKVPL